MGATYAQSLERHLRVLLFGSMAWEAVGRIATKVPWPLLLHLRPSMLAAQRSIHSWASDDCPAKLRCRHSPSGHRSRQASHPPAYGVRQRVARPDTSHAAALLPRIATL